jgi:hypothetical protein
VSARQDPNFDPDVANLVESAAVGTALLIDDLFAEDAFAEGFKVGLEFLLRGFVFRRDFSLQLFLEFPG